MVGWFETEPPYVTLAGLELAMEKLASLHRNLPVSASQVLEFHGSFSDRKEYHPTSSYPPVHLEYIHYPLPIKWSCEVGADPCFTGQETEARTGSCCQAAGGSTQETCPWLVGVPHWGGRPTQMVSKTGALWDLLSKPSGRHAGGKNLTIRSF